MEGVIRFSEERKKWNDINKRRKMFDEQNYICNKCFKKKRYHELVIEHDYPCILGGKSVRVWCNDCHNPKTDFDLKVIAFFKKMEFICTTRYETHIFIDEDELKDLYYTLRRLELVKVVE